MLKNLMADTKINKYNFPYIIVKLIHSFKWSEFIDKTFVLINWYLLRILNLLIKCHWPG